MIYYYTDIQNFSKQIKYIFEFFSQILGIKIKQLENNSLSQNDIVISYSKNPTHFFCNQIIIFPSNFFGKNYLKKKSLPKIPLKRRQKLPIIYQGVNKINNHIKKTKNLIETDIDIIASSFFMITRYEEVILKKKDEFGNFKEENNLTYKENFLSRPIVDEYIELLWSWLKKLDPILKKKNPWGNKNFAVALTHDIDEIKKYRRPPIFTIVRAIKEKKLKKAKKIVCNYIRVKTGLEKDPYLKSFDYITNLEKKYGFQSSFYFMTSGERYSLQDHDLKKIFQKLKKENFEIGIHPSFKAYNNLQTLKLDKKKLEKTVGEKIIGGRQHYLNWDVLRSWETWEIAGLKYDATLGFNKYIGFRCGTCRPFKPFALLKNRVVDIWEIPLIIMDGALSKKRLALIREYNPLLQYIKIVKKYQGIFVILWHNSYMTNLFTPEHKKTFEHFYSYLSQENCLVSSIEQLIKTYVRNSWNS